MASFPGSVKTFTSKNSGDVIQAAHINDLQDEVNAIEAGYINGTAPLNSSRSTVVALSAGASTLASLSVSGASTLASLVVTPGACNINTLDASNSTLANLQVTAASTFTGAMTVSSNAMFLEVSTVAAASANAARLYARDNGAGKTQLVVIFPSGAGQILATEP